MTEITAVDRLDGEYTMTVDLAVLESLGINLYSNAAAVLSELVANAYDADASTIQIEWKSDATAATVLVTDDGAGMNYEELNTRFLAVGYKKRQDEGTASSKWQRPFMGRKGIGKLSIFSIANTVEVYSTKEGTSRGFRIIVADLQAAIARHEDYHPSPCPVPPAYAKQGTTLLLTDLRSKRAALTVAALRKRLARRFDVLDQTPADRGGFAIHVNGKRITFMDRQELKKLEFIWEFGSATLPDEVLPPDVTRFVVTNNVVEGDDDWVVHGWFGTARRPTDLTNDEDAGSLKNIIVLARKRPIQEGIVDKLDFSRIFGNYVTGQIEADFLDLDGGYDDIATSDRQRLIEDDPRVIALRKLLREAFLRASDEWTAARPKKEAAAVLGRYPKLKSWVEKRPEWQREAARTMIGTIASLALEKSAKEDRIALFRSGILAFERVGLRKAADQLALLSNVTALDLLPLLADQDSYEAGLWVDILRSRVQAISKFRDLTTDDEKEKVLQKHLFGHLWLIDPSWERATVGGRMEEDLRRLHPVFAPTDADGEPITGRIDIHYATASGKHIIVELKRYSVKEDVTDLVDQGLKYYTALASVLAKQNRATEEIEVVFVLGDRPGARGKGRLTEDEYRKDQFHRINGRTALYDELIENAKRQYEEYLAASDKARELDELLGSIDQEIMADSDD